MTLGIIPQAKIVAEGICMRKKKRKSYKYKFRRRVSRKEEEKAITKIGECGVEDIIPAN